MTGETLSMGALEVDVGCWLKTDQHPGESRSRGTAWSYGKSHSTAEDALTAASVQNMRRRLLKLAISSFKFKGLISEMMAKSHFEAVGLPNSDKSTGRYLQKFALL